MSEGLAPRNRYRGSGRVAWTRFIPAVCLALAWTAAMAIGTDLVWRYTHEGRLRILASILAVVAVAGVARLTISVGRCRSRAVAALLGIILALGATIGPPYVGLVHRVGWANAGRLYLLPYFIDHRDIPPGAAATVPPPKPAGYVGRVRGEDRFLNWYAFGFAAVIGFWLCVRATVKRAGRVYCERCDAWADREVSFLPSGSANALAPAARVGDWGAIEAIGLTPRAVVATNERRYACATLQHCQTTLADGDTGCLAFLSLREVKFGGGLSRSAQADQAFGRTVVPPTEVYPRELPRLVGLFPGLRSKLAPDALPTAAATTATASGMRRGAEIWDVPEQHRGLILTRGAIAAGNLMSLAGLALMFGFLGTAGLAAYWGEAGHTRHFGNFTFSTAYAVTMGAGSIGLALLTGIVALRNPSGPANRWLRRRAEREVAGRANPLVRPEEPGAAFVEIVPREHWGRPMMETATDLGFALIDGRSGELRFEGDRERYRVPLESVLRCEVTPAFAGAGTAGEVPYYMVVLHVRLVDGTVREISMTPRATLVWGPKDHRERAAREFAMRVQPGAAGWMPRGFEVDVIPGR